MNLKKVMRVEMVEAFTEIKMGKALWSCDVYTEMIPDIGEV